jgi:hypothetical protein
VLIGYIVVHAGQVADTDFVDGLWGMAIADSDNGLASMFTSNVLDGSVVRFDMAYSADGGRLEVFNQVNVASGYSHRFDPAAFVLGPPALTSMSSTTSCMLQTRLTT